MEYQWDGPARAADVYAAGRPVAHIAKTLMRERAEAAILDGLWHYTTMSMEGSAVRVDRPGEQLVARRPSRLSTRWEVSGAGIGYLVTPGGCLSRSFFVSRDGRRIGESRPQSFWANRPSLIVPDDVPVTHAVYLLWICFLMRQRAGATAVAAG